MLGVAGWGKGGVGGLFLLTDLLLTFNVSTSTKSVASPGKRVGIGFALSNAIPACDIACRNGAVVGPDHLNCRLTGNNGSNGSLLTSFDIVSRGASAFSRA